jgi:hypothetical protein
VKSAIADAQELVRGEIALARTELRGEVKRFGAGVAAMAAAAVAGILALTLLLTAGAWAISELLQWPVWAGFAIVGIVVAIAAALLAVVGRRRFTAERHMPLTVDTMKENMEWMRAQKS